MLRVVPKLVVLAVGAAVLGGCSAGAPAPTTTADLAGITARGLGTVTGTPDTVTIVLGVTTQAATAKAALDANNTKATAVIDMLKGAGVAAADLQTSELSVNPTYGPTGRIVGYEVSNLVRVTLHDIAASGAMIDAAAGAAGDSIRVQQLSFSIDDDSALRAQARAAAVRQAQAQAKQLADAAGVSLGPIRSISEVRAGAPNPNLRTDAQAGAASLPVEPGTQELEVTVEIVYGIDQ